MDPSDLRQAAIDLLQQSSSELDARNEPLPQELLHELRVHQIELEMQNEELRRAQLELEESRDKFANLFDFAPVGYVTLDDSHRIVEANLTFAKLLGAERRTLTGQVLAQYVVPEDATRLYHHLRDTAAADTKASCELKLKKVDGSLLCVRLDSITTGNGGRSIAIADLSENADLTRAKRDSDERLRVICHALPIPVAYIDRAGKYQFNNAAHEQWFHISRESIISRDVKEVLGDEIYKLVEPRIKRALAGRACSCRVELPDGERGPRSVEIHYAPHRDEKGEVAGFHELMFDIGASLRWEETETRRADLEDRLKVLSTRQRSVFELLIAGRSNKTIARELDRSMRTIERDRHEILHLLGVESINELLLKFAGLSASDHTIEGAD